MELKRLKIPTIILAVVALVVGASSGAVAAKLITSADVKNDSLKSEDIKNGTLTTNDIKKAGVNGDRLKNASVGKDKLKDGAVTSPKLNDGAVNSAKIKNGSIGTIDLANGSVTADKLAPGAVAFPQTLWGPMIRNQAGAAQSFLATGPATPPENTGSLHLSVTGPADLAAFGDSIDFAGIQLDDITSLSYSSYNPDAVPVVRPSLRMEINPHLVDDSAVGGVFEFTTLIYEPAPGATGWVDHADIQADPEWYLTGTEGTTTGCTQANRCTFAGVTAALNGHVDTDDTKPAISSGVYFALGSNAPATTAAVDRFVFNNFLFDFEANGVFLTTPVPAP